MRLKVFGKVGIDDSGFSRPKPLLLLSYLAVEGDTDRHRLAELFWNGDNDQKGIAKKLAKLSVVLAQFKKEGAYEAIPDIKGINPIPFVAECDALDFVAALEKNDLLTAIQHYTGGFLKDLGRTPDKLDISAELMEWIFLKREELAEQARTALLAVAEEAFVENDFETAKKLASQALELEDAPEAEPAVLAKIQVYLGDDSSKSSAALQKDVQEYLDELSEDSLKVFMALSLQPVPNLSIVRNGLSLSLGQINDIREELILAGLIDDNVNIKATGLANDWLGANPAERITLLLQLARHSSPEDAFPLYQDVYKRTQGFGGLGDTKRARAAYATKAKTLIDNADYHEAAKMLENLREAEAIFELDLDERCTFLEAYAMERTGSFKEGLELLNKLPEAEETPDVIALKSVLFWRRGKSDEAKVAADKAIDSGLDWLWARATGLTTLGYLDHSDGDFSEGASKFKKAASLFQASNDTVRWIGALNNYAITLMGIAQDARGKNSNSSKIKALFLDATHAFERALSSAEELDENIIFRTRILILMNLGIIQAELQDWDAAEKYFVQVHKYAEDKGVLDVQSRIYLNLGRVYEKQGKLDQAKQLLTQSINLTSQNREFKIQAKAMGTLAKINNDSDSMEIALDLLQESGNTSDFEFFQSEFASILLKAVNKSIVQNDLSKAKRLLHKLLSLHINTDSLEGKSNDALRLSYEHSLLEIQDKSSMQLLADELSKQYKETPLF